VLGALAVAALNLGIVEGGVDDRGAKIIEHDPAWDAAEKLERRAVHAQPRLDGLVEDELGVLVATERERHHEHPRAAHAAGLRIEELAGVPEVDLGFLARRHFESHGGAIARGRASTQEPLHRRVAAGEPVLLDEELPDGLAFDAALVQREHALPQRLDEGLLVRGPLGRRRHQ